MQPVRHFLLALQFFTRIPVTGRLAAWVGFSPAMLRASAAHFPGVGWVVGGLSALVFWSLMSALPAQAAAPWVAAVLSTAFSVWLTGAFHEDGLADTADGLGACRTWGAESENRPQRGQFLPDSQAHSSAMGQEGGEKWTAAAGLQPATPKSDRLLGGAVGRERALAIMKDSRIGSYGALALVLAILSKVALLALLAQAGGAWLAALALFAAHVTSRLMPLFVIRTLAHVGDTHRSKSKPLADGIANAGLFVGLLWWALALALVGWLAPGAPWLPALLGALLGLAWMWRLLQRRLQGFTGDGLGATQQVCELLFYLGLALAL